MNSATLDPPSANKQRQRKWLRRWIKFSALGLLALLILLLITGVVYQIVGTASDVRRYPPPGQLVSVGDYRLHLHCMGEGSPTVVLEAMAGGTSVNWAWIQPEVAQTTRVCAYDRAGRGWSDASVPARDLWGTAEDLHTLLHNAGIEGPYILVGHSIGGLYMRAFAQQYLDEAIGVVLIDSAHPEQYERYPEYARQRGQFERLSALFPILARLGAFRLFFATGGEIDFQNLPPRAHDELAAFWSSPVYWHSQRAEGAAAPTIYTQAQELGSLGDRPLAVISAGISPASWLSLQAELPSLSTNSVHVTINEATHGSLAFHPDHAHQTSQTIFQILNVFLTLEMK